MAKEIWWLLGLGAVTLGGLFLYGQSRDSKDPFGFITDFWNDNFVEGGKFIVPKSLIEGGKIIPRNLDFRKPTLLPDYFKD